MHRDFSLRPAATLVTVAATVALIALAPAYAQSADPAATTAALSAPPAAATAPRQPTCTVAAEKARFDLPLVRTARRLAAHQPIRIVALGSSSTFGAGASTSAASYPSRLADELTQRLPGHDITVLNRGVNGEEAADMLARLDTAVIAEKPDLVLWQVGSN